MRKTVTAIFFAALMCILLPVYAFAETEGESVAEYYRLSDPAGVLTAGEEAELSAKLDEMSLRLNTDVAIAAVDGIEDYGSIQECADDVYELFGYGRGSEKDGVLLLVSVGSREWAISTCGFGVKAFTQAGIEYINEKIKPAFAGGDYAGAFNTFAQLCEEFIKQAKSGEPYDRGNLPRGELSLVWIPVSVGIGILLALIIVGGMKGRLKSVRSQAAANSYMKKNSLNITESSDLFLYSTVKATEKQKKETGSSTHTSSSGTTHGGGSGKF